MNECIFQDYVSHSSVRVTGSNFSFVAGEFPRAVRGSLQLKLLKFFKILKQ